MIETPDEIAWRILPSNDRTTLHEDWAASKYRVAVSVAIAAERTRVENMEDEIARLRAALEPFVKRCDEHEAYHPVDFPGSDATVSIQLRDIRKARAALLTEGGKSE